MKRKNATKEVCVIIDGNPETIKIPNHLAICQVCKKIMSADEVRTESNYGELCEECATVLEESGVELDFENDQGRKTIMKMTTVKMSRDKFERINALLDIEDIEELSDEKQEEIHALPESEIIYDVEFDDGTVITLSLEHGSTNFYTSPYITNRNGQEIDSDDDVGFSLETEEEFLVPDDDEGDEETTYVVKVELTA